MEPNIKNKNHLSGRTRQNESSWNSIVAACMTCMRFCSAVSMKTWVRSRNGRLRRVLCLHESSRTLESSCKREAIMQCFCTLVYFLCISVLICIVCFTYQSLRCWPPQEFSGICWATIWLEERFLISSTSNQTVVSLELACNSRNSLCQVSQKITVFNKVYQPTLIFRSSRAHWVDPSCGRWKMFQKLLTPEIESSLSNQMVLIHLAVSLLGLQCRLPRPARVGRVSGGQIIKRSETALKHCCKTLLRKEIDCSETLVEKTASRLSEPGIVD